MSKVYLKYVVVTGLSLVFLCTGYLGHQMVRNGLHDIAIV